MTKPSMRRPTSLTHTLKTVSLAIVGLYTLHFALGTQDQNYGLGGVSTARLGAITAEIDNDFATLTNPSLLAWQRKSSLNFSSSLVGFLAPQSQSSVIVDHPVYRTQNGTLREAPFPSPSFSNQLWTLGLQVPFSFKGISAGFGTLLSGAYQSLRTFESFTPYDFSLVRYGTADQQFKGTASLGVSIIPKLWSVGAGLSLFITGQGNSDAFLVDENPTGRLALNVGLNTALVAGTYLNLEKSGSVGLTFRQAIHPIFEQSFSGKVQVFENTTSVTLPAELKTNLYYEPQLIELDYQKSFGDVKLSAGVSYQFWSAYQPFSLQLETTNVQGVVRKTQLPKYQFRNTWNPRVSVESPAIVPHLKILGGYAYRPSFIEAIADSGNLLDSPAHMLGLGFAYEIQSFPFLEVPLELTFGSQFHFLEERVIQKEQAGMIGYPGYRFSGKTYAFSLGLKVFL